MDAVSDPSIHTVVVKSSAQVGKTEIINNSVGYFIDQDASPMLLLQPTLEMAQAWSKDRFAPMLRDTPVLRGKVKDPRARDSGNTILHKTFPGGHITMCGANSPASLASRPIRVVLADEINRYPVSAGTEGDSLALARKRTTTFWNKKIIITSTPTEKGASRIDDEFEVSDQRIYMVPCPHCGHEQDLKWANVFWGKKEGKHDPSSAKYGCEECGAMWSDAERWAAIRWGKWVAQKEFNGVAGFFLNQFYSPWVTLAEIVIDFLNSKDNPELLKVWTNTVLGEAFDPAQDDDKVDSDLLYLRREHFTFPKEAVALTVGIDTQDDRFEIQWDAWGAGEERWTIDYMRLFGDPARDEIWNKLGEVITKQYKREDGVYLSPLLACQDHGGHYSDEVCKFSLRMGNKFLIPVKGSSIYGKPVAIFPKTKDRKGTYLTIVGTDTAKDLLHQRLKIQSTGPGYWHFPVNEKFDSEYFRQLCAEKRIAKYVRGHKFFIWDAQKKRQEPWDCSVYSLAAVRILQQHFGLNLETFNPVVEQDRPRGRRVRSRGIGR